MARRELIPVAIPSLPLNSKQALRLKLQFSLVGVDLAAVAVGFIVSGWLRFGSPLDVRTFGFLVLLLPWYVLVATNNRAYGLDALIDNKCGTPRALVALGATAALLTALLFYLKTGALYSRQVFGVGVIASAVLIPYRTLDVHVRHWAKSALQAK